MFRIVAPINARAAVNLSSEITVQNFVEDVFLPFYRRKWKRITNESRTASITHHIVGQSIWSFDAGIDGRTPEGCSYKDKKDSVAGSRA